MPGQIPGFSGFASPLSSARFGSRGVNTAIGGQGQRFGVDKVLGLTSGGRHIPQLGGSSFTSPEISGMHMPLGEIQRPMPSRQSSRPIPGGAPGFGPQPQDPQLQGLPEWLLGLLRRFGIQV